MWYVLGNPNFSNPPGEQYKLKFEKSSLWKIGGNNPAFEVGGGGGEEK